MTFGEDMDGGEDAALLKRLQKAMEVLKVTCITTTPDGKLPGDVRDRLSLLFASISKLTIAATQARAAAEDDGADMDEVDALMNMMINDLIKVAVVVAMRFTDEHHQHESTFPEFSTN